MDEIERIKAAMDEACGDPLAPVREAVVECDRLRAEAMAAHAAGDMVLADRLLDEAEATIAGCERALVVQGVAPRAAA